VTDATRRRMCAAALALPLAAALRIARAAEPAGPPFTFRGRPYAPTGSHVSRRMTWTGALPFDRAYAELTPGEIADIREQYDSIDADEEPPFPVDGLHVIFDAFDLAIDASTPRLDPGAVVVVAKVDDKGGVDSVAVYKSPHPFVTTALTQALLKTPFKPARKAGTPVAMPFLLKVDLQ